MSDEKRTTKEERAEVLWLLKGMEGYNRSDVDRFIDLAPRLVADVERLEALLAKAPLRSFDSRAADALADEVAVLVTKKVIDSRSPAADALLDYRNPPTSSRADALAAERERSGRLEAALRALLAGTNEAREALRRDAEYLSELPANRAAHALDTLFAARDAARVVLSDAALSEAPPAAPAFGAGPASVIRPLVLVCGTCSAPWVGGHQCPVAAPAVTPDREAEVRREARAQAVNICEALRASWVSAEWRAAAWACAEEIRALGSRE